MILPSKLQSGQNFKKSTVRTVNEIIDYLKTQRISGDNKTIRIDQQTAGITIHALPQNGVSRGGKSSTYTHPFQLYFGVDQNENQVLHIRLGFLEMTGSDQSRLAVAFEDENEIGQSLPLPDEEGEYIVTLFCWWDYNNEDSQLGWVYRVLYVPDETLPNEIMQNDGFFHIMLGSISVQENEDGELTYNITKQYVNSDFAVYDGNIKAPFKAYLSLYDQHYGTYPEDGDVLDEPLMPTKLIINWGKVYINGKIIGKDPSWWILGENPTQSYYCLAINTLLNYVSSRRFSLNQYVFTEDNITYYIPICRTVYESNSLVGIVPYIEDNFCFNIEDDKVMICKEDQIPDYLNEKIKYPTIEESNLTEDQVSTYVSGHQYIKGVIRNVVSSFVYPSGVFIANNTGTPQWIDSEQQVTLTGLYNELYWDYSAISGWSRNTIGQQIINVSGELKWDDAYKVRVSGTVQDQPGYLSEKIVTGQELSSKVTDNCKLKLWAKRIVNGYNLDIREGNSDSGEQPYKVFNAHRSNVNGGNGIKCTTTNTNQNHTHTYLLEIDYPNFALEVDGSLANLISVSKSSGGIKLTSALSGNGIMIMNGSQISVLSPPQAVSVLTWNGSAYQWVEVDYCDSCED